MSTYQQDYTKPSASCNGVLQPPRSNVNAHYQPVYARRLKCAKATPIELEWTGIGLMGKKLHPCLIPNIYTNQQLEDILQSRCNCSYQN